MLLKKAKGEGSVQGWNSLFATFLAPQGERDFVDKPILTDLLAAGQNQRGYKRRKKGCNYTAIALRAISSHKQRSSMCPN